MNLVMVAVVLLLVVAAIIFLVQKRPHHQPAVVHRVASPKPKNQSTAKNYSAVGIRPHLLACKAVQEYYGKRFLVGHAPMVPVAGCTIRSCPCRYEHFADRRTDDDRRAEFGIRNARNIAGTERRRNDRRHAPLMS